VAAQLRIILEKCFVDPKVVDQSVPSPFPGDTLEEGVVLHYQGVAVVGRDGVVISKLLLYIFQTVSMHYYNIIQCTQSEFSDKM